MVASPCSIQTVHQGRTGALWRGISCSYCSLLHGPLVFPKGALLSESLTIHYGPLKRPFTPDTTGSRGEKAQIDSSTQRRFTAYLHVHEWHSKEGNCRLYTSAILLGFHPSTPFAFTIAAPLGRSSKCQSDTNISH